MLLNEAARPSGAHVLLIFIEGLLEDVQSGVQLGEFIGSGGQLIRGQGRFEGGEGVPQHVKVLPNQIITPRRVGGSGPCGIAEPIDLRTNGIQRVTVERLATLGAR